MTFSKALCSGEVFRMCHHFIYMCKIGVNIEETHRRTCLSIIFLKCISDGDLIAIKRTLHYLLSKSIHAQIGSNQEFLS